MFQTMILQNATNLLRKFIPEGTVSWCHYMSSLSIRLMQCQLITSGTVIEESFVKVSIELIPTY